MRKLVESTFVTLDGVIGSPEVWGAKYWNQEHADYAMALLSAADALLLGRRTYDGFAASWPLRSGDPYTDKINAMPKHIASRTLVRPIWNSSVIDGDLATQVAKLKGRDGGHILKFGTGEVDRALMADKLVDEFHFWLFPTYAGRGTRLFDGWDAGQLELLSTEVFSTGIVVLVYAPS